MSRLLECCIIFTKKEARRVAYPDDDTLVILSCISNKMTRRILFDERKFSKHHFLICIRLVKNKVG